MPILTPPPRRVGPIEPVGDAEALIEEARRRTRRRRVRNAGGAIVALGVAGLLLVNHGRGGTSTAPVAPASQPAVHVRPSSGLMGDGPITVIKQFEGTGGIVYARRGGLSSLVLPCRESGLNPCEELQNIAWSPDGTRIALGTTSYGATSTYDGIHVVDPKTGRDVQLTEFPSRWGWGWADPAWSPDGAWLAYDGLKPSRLYLVKTDGTQHTSIPTGTSGQVQTPTWSPDGTRIAFQSGKSIYAIRLNGTHLRLLAQHGSAPAWSPAGGVIAYRVWCGTRLVTPTGRDATPPDNHACRHIGVPGEPVWSPDGRKIAIADTRPGTSHGLYTMNADGSHLVRLTSQLGNTAAGAARPSWRPR